MITIFHTSSVLLQTINIVSDCDFSYFFFVQSPVAELVHLLLQLENGRKILSSS